jgi:hypothetical protein
MTVNEVIQSALGVRQKAGGPYLTTVHVFGADVDVYVGEYGWCRPLVSLDAHRNICWMADPEFSWGYMVRFSDGAERTAHFAEAIALVEDGVDLAALKAEDRKRGQP